MASEFEVWTQKQTQERKLEYNKKRDIFFRLLTKPKQRHGELGKNLTKT